jgi:DNA polymerase-3 subunit gamma/tau
MSYKALYLTYRPQTFEEVAGQKAIVRTLKNALSSGKMAHAYLFAGPRGTGKTTMARLFAKALDCEEGVGHQCNKCSNCLAISEGSHPDVIEIDAASNNGVDQVRDLIEKVKYAPIKGKYKVYIIDEVHMMSTGAFNALLKTLEEPPENVIFILCTTEPYKVLPTILSRCQRFDFGKLTDEEMHDKLIEVLKAEKSEYDEKGVSAIISLADGGMRDALSILDQVLAYSDNKLHEQDVLAIFGLASVAEKIALLKELHNGEIAGVISKAEDMLSAGIDIRRLVADLIGVLKDLLIYEKTSSVNLLETLDEAQAKDLSRLLSPEECSAMITTLLDAQNNFKNVSDVRSLFELTLLQLASVAEKTVQTVQSIPVKKPANREPIVEKATETPKEVVTPAPVQASPSPKKEEPLAPTPSPAPKAVEVPVAESSAPAEEKGVVEPPDFLFEEEKPQEPVEEKVQEAPAPKVEAKAAPAPKPTPAPAPSEEHLDTSNILKPEIATSGDMFAWEDSEIMKVIVTNNKSERAELKTKWHLLDELRGNPSLGNLATLLAEGSPICINHDAIVLSYNFTKLSKKCNIKENQEALASLLSRLFDDKRKVFVYGIDPNDRNRIIMAFNNLNQVGKLPSKQEAATLNLPK